MQVNIIRFSELKKKGGKMEKGKQQTKRKLYA